MTDFDQTRIAHLTIIQGVIARMAGNSFILKTLAVTLATGIVALIGAIQNPSWIFPLAGLVPIIIFWWLDSRYLRLERQYRRLYDDVRLGKSNDPFAMDTGQYRAHQEALARIALSWSESSLYAPLLVLLALIAVGLAVSS